MEKKRDEFYEIISDLVDYHQRHNLETRTNISEILGVTDGYIRKIHSAGNNKKYNMKHLFLLARHWGIDISKLYPSEDNLKLIIRYESMNVEQRKEKIKELEDILKEENKYE